MTVRADSSPAVYPRCLARRNERIPRKGLIRLFSRTEIKRWRGYLVTLEEICKVANWSGKYSNELKSVLKLLEPFDLRQVLSYCHLPVTATIERVGQTRGARYIAGSKKLSSQAEEVDLSDWVE